MTFIQAILIEITGKEGNIYMITYIILGLILGYTGFIIYGKVKDVRAGKSSCSSCSGCPVKDSCRK